MSVLGTGIAAAVAGTNLNARQVSKERDKQRTDRNQAERVLKDEFVEQLAEVDKPENTDTNAPMHIDEQDDHHQEDENPAHVNSNPEAHHPENTGGPHYPAAYTVRGNVPQTQAQQQLYRHLDIAV